MSGMTPSELSRTQQTLHCIAARRPDVHDAAHAPRGLSVRSRHENFETNIAEINSWRPPVTGDIL
jgi:hypothetical protein